MCGGVMPNAEKVAKVEELKERIRGSNALLLAEYRGLTVHDATELRRSLSETARFLVVKNTLMRLAAGEAGIRDMEPILEGPTAVAFVQGDVVAAAKGVVDAAKRFPALVLKGAYLDGKVLDGAAAQALATLESREVMLSKVAGMLKAEMTRAASMLQVLQGRFLGLLEAYKEKVPGHEDANAAAAETAPEETEDAPSAETEAAADTAEPDDAPAEEARAAAAEQTPDEETAEGEPSAANEEG